MDLADARFITSALAEVQAGLHGLRHPRKHSLHSPLSGHLPTGRDGRLAFLMDLHAPPEWAPDGLSPQPTSLEVAEPREQIATIHDLDLATAESDLDFLGRCTGAARWRAMTPRTYRALLADAALWYWDNTLSALWTRISAIASADRTYRSVAVANNGMVASLKQLSPHAKVVAGSIVCSPIATTAVYVTFGAGMRLVPTVLRAPRMSLRVQDGHVILSYGARGAARLWERASEDDSPLHHMLGRNRAEIMRILTIPNTTTAIAAMIELAPSTVSSHLATLRNGQLLTSWREGRRVLYGLTELGEQLLSAAGRPVPR